MSMTKVEEQKILDEASQAAEEVFSRSPQMTRDEYDHVVAKEVLDRSSNLGQSIAKTAKRMKDRALKDGDEFRAKAINRSKNSIGYLVREALKNS